MDEVIKKMVNEYYNCDKCYDKIDCRFGSGCNTAWDCCECSADEFADGIYAERKRCGCEEPKEKPITEEWLLENGFERLHYFEPKLAFSSKDKRVEVVECENADEWNVHIDDNRSISLGNLCCTTTRQLIEFCRLCGYELK